MNIYYLSDNMARLAPTTGSIRHVLSNRTYKEVRWPVGQAAIPRPGARPRKE